MTSILVCGSLAFDDIGFFDQRLAADTRNVKLTRLYRAFGGCAMNIAYNLKHLGDEPLPFVYVGDDYEPEYQAHLTRLAISQRGVRRVPDALSSRGIVLTDNQGAQFTAFIPVLRCRTITPKRSKSCKEKSISRRPSSLQMFPKRCWPRQIN